MESRGLRSAMALGHCLSLRHDLVTPLLRVIYRGVWRHPQTFNIRAWLERKAARVFRGRSCTKRPCTPGKWSFHYPTTQKVTHDLWSLTSDDLVQFKVIAQNVSFIEWLDQIDITLAPLCQRNSSPHNETSIIIYFIGSQNIHKTAMQHCPKEAGEWWETNKK